MTPAPESSKPLPIYKSFAASAIAACTAEVGPWHVAWHIACCTKGRC